MGKGGWCYSKIEFTISFVDVCLCHCYPFSNCSSCSGCLGGLEPGALEAEVDPEVGIDLVAGLDPDAEIGPTRDRPRSWGRPRG